MIISASRRTDIPAFYSEWFFNRLREGLIVTRNPFNANQLTKLRLSPDVVDAIVFWTKNPEPMLERLPELDAAGIAYYFQFTLTPYEKDLEPGLPSKPELVKTFKDLSEHVGRDRVIWRYDPILLSEKYSVEYHERAFGEYAQLLAGSTNHVVISFLDMDYNNTKRMQKLGVSDGSADEKARLAKTMADSAHAENLSISTCAEEIDLDSIGISHGCCIDGNLIERLTGRSLRAKKDKNQRALCGCMESVDVGTYNTCRHGCAYCYANFSSSTIAANCKKHNPASPVLLGECDANALPFKKGQKSLLEQQASLF